MSSCPTQNPYRGVAAGGAEFISFVNPRGTARRWRGMVRVVVVVVLAVVPLIN